jgi:hypothetical protein
MESCAAEGLAVGDHVGAHAEVLLGAAWREPEADEHLVEDENDARCVQTSRSRRSHVA